MPLGLTWLGHSTTLLELDGVRVLTDPVLRRRFAHLVRRVPDPEVDGRPIDAVLISHAHRDHLDLPSLRLLPDGIQVVVPRGVEPLVTRAGLRNVAELREGDELSVGDVYVRAVPAVHDGGRGLPRDTTDTIGFLVRGSSIVYFAGDTDVFPEMEALRPVDLALLPVSGWGARVPAGHLDPARAARALQLVRPRYCVPVHWGTFRPFYRRDPYPADVTAGDELIRRAEALAPEVEVRVLRPGDRTEFP
jgi:L-ascorbate metabolism protein UlaG (beta-lactamase superfamily)